MPDRLYLSCWLTEAAQRDLLIPFGLLLDHFPSSKLAVRGPALRIYALEHAEPPVMEREFPPGTETPQLIESAREFMKDDCACFLDMYWDLWQLLEDDWKIAPAGVTLACYGAGFDNDFRDHLRIDFGLDTQFLPREGTDTRMIQSNIRSLLHLVGDLDRALPLERRILSSEGGGSFAEMLHDSLSGLRII
jgi:hypothetical protein